MSTFPVLVSNVSQLLRKDQLTLPWPAPATTTSTTRSSRWVPPWPSSPSSLRHTSPRCRSRSVPPDSRHWMDGPRTIRGLADRTLCPTDLEGPLAGTYTRAPSPSAPEPSISAGMAGVSDHANRRQGGPSRVRQTVGRCSLPLMAELENLSRGGPTTTPHRVVAPTRAHGDRRRLLC
jgi:hypothetical protein